MRKALIALALLGVVGTVPALAQMDRGMDRDRGMHRGYVYGMPRGQYHRGTLGRHRLRHRMRRHHRRILRHSRRLYSYGYGHRDHRYGR